MEILLGISILWLLITSLILFRNLFDFGALAAENQKSGQSVPMVSICIPARNEESVIERAVSSVLRQTYPNFEVLVLDDDSDDRTPEILSSLSKSHGELTVIQGQEKPGDWLGKPWACQQLGEAAKGDILIFMDADVWLDSDAVSKTVSALESRDALTVWPKQFTGTFWEQMVIPLIYHSLYTLLPAKYVERKPRWMPEVMHRKLSPEFAAACGQFFAFRKEAYTAIGRHEAVKQAVVEDVELAKNLKRNHQKLKMYHGVGTVNCRMYTSHRELFSGLRKNFFAGFNKNIPFFVLMSVFHLIVFISPVFILLFAVLNGNYPLAVLSVIPLLLITLQRLLLDVRFGWNPTLSLLHPVSVLWYQILGVVSVKDHLSGKKAVWKGREV